MSVADRGMGLGLRAVRTIAGSPVVDRLGVREHTERLLFRASRDGFRAAGSGARAFSAATRLGRPVRLRTGGGDLFDLTPTDEQAMLTEAFGEFAERRLRPAAQQADAAGRASDELMAEAVELGLATLGVPDELGGAVAERSTVTAVLVAEALARGDMGLAAAALAPAGVASALALWGDADQQSAYLPAFVGESPPAAAIALGEPGALRDPLEPATRARRDGDDLVLTGVKTLVPRAADAELLVVGAALDDRPVLMVVEPGATDGVEVRAAPSMGVRAGALGDLRLDDVRLPATALLAEGDPTAYAECVRRSRLAWCALGVGAARAVLDYVIPYVNERKAFGEPISHRQAVAFAVSDIAIELEGMRLATLRAAARADAGEEFARDVALASALCAEKGTRIGSEGVQLLGGHGFVQEHPVERWYRDLRAVGVLEGGLLV